MLLPCRVIVLYSVLCCQLGSCEVGTTEEFKNVNTVYALVGRRVAIPCMAHPSSKEDSVALILWYKDNDTTPMYSLDARQGKLEQARHASKDLLTSRAFLNVLTEPATLILDPVLVKDEGEYKCRADFRNERTRYSSITLKVVVESERPVIKDSSGEIIQSLIGPYNEGESLILVCEVEGGRPFPTVTWWRETVLLDETYELLPNNVVRNELQIAALKRHDLMAMFICHTTNNNITAPLISSVTIDMNCSVFIVRPLSVSIEGEKWEMKVNEQVELTCHAVGSRPPARLTWQLGKKRLKSTRDTVSVDGNITRSLLLLTPSRNDNGVYLSCRAENTLIFNSAIEYGRMLDVRFAPHISLKYNGKPHRTEIAEGRDIYLDCEIESNPPFSELVWKFEGMKLQTNRSRGIIVSNQSLIIQKIHRSNSGRYSCVASNLEGITESDSFMLTVQYLPVCTHHETVVYRGVKNEPIKISCEVEAEPEPLAFRWKVNTSVDTGQLVTVVNDGPRSIASYIPNSDAEFGIIECWGKNTVGEQISPCAYTVLPASGAQKHKVCAIVNQTETSFTIQCIGDSENSVNEVLLMEVYNTVTGKLEFNSSSDIGTLSARNLPLGRNFSVKVYSFNASGNSEPLLLEITTLQWPSSLTRKDDTENDDFQFLIPVIISTVLTTSVCVIIVVWKTRRYIMKRSNTNMRMNQKCQTPIHRNNEEERKPCSYIGDERGPDIIPEIKDNNTSDDVICEDILFTVDMHKDTEIVEQIKCKMKTSNISSLRLSPMNKSPSPQNTILNHYLSSPSKSLCSSANPVIYTRQTKV